MDDATFKALADPTRRLILDRLFDRDGQSLGELVAAVPGMTRFGVMKHLAVLEESGLVTTAKDGRERRHFLNPVPIALIHDRWVSKFAAPWVRLLVDLKRELEGIGASGPRHQFLIFVDAAPARLWQALTDPAETERWFGGLRREGALAPGAPFVYRAPDGTPALTGEIAACVPMRHFALRWRPHAVPPDEPATRVAWDITPTEDGGSRLHLVHDGFPGESDQFREAAASWPAALLSLKNHVEGRGAVRVA